MGIETGERNVLVISLCSTLVFLARDIFHHGDLNSSTVQHPLFPPHSAKTFLLYPKSQNHSLKAPVPSPLVRIYHLFAPQSLPPKNVSALLRGHLLHCRNSFMKDVRHHLVLKNKALCLGCGGTNPTALCHHQFLQA